MEKCINSKKELLTQWFDVKLEAHEQMSNRQFKEGEIWWCKFGENIGVEVNGKSEIFARPALVFRKLNKHSFMSIPLTSQKHCGSWYVEFEFCGVKNYANLAQAKTISSKRLHNRIGEMTRGDFTKVKKAFRALYCEEK